MNSNLIYITLALLAGCMIPFQSAMNAGLGKSLQSPYFSALIVFIIAFFGIGVYILISRQHVPELTQFVNAPKWAYFGGILGGVYILMIVLLAPKLGIGNVTVMVLLGQVVAAIIIDHFGLLGATVHLINWKRLIGVCLMIAGIFMVKKF